MTDKSPGRSGKTHNRRKTGVDACDHEKKIFVALAARFAASSDPSEQNQLKRELARFIYGE